MIIAGFYDTKSFSVLGGKCVMEHTLIIGKDGVIKRIFEGAGDADAQYEKYKIAIEEALK